MMDVFMYIDVDNIGNICLNNASSHHMLLFLFGRNQGI